LSAETKDDRTSCDLAFFYQQWLYPKPLHDLSKTQVIEQLLCFSLTHCSNEFFARMNPYRLLSSLIPTRPAPSNPQRIVLILPCCIGDVVLATATLKALRRGYPDAHITWAVGSWSKGVIEHHDLLDATLDTGPEALPVRSFSRFVRQLRTGHFALAVSLVRSPLMSAALLLSGIPHCAGLDSAGRGFGYTVRAPIDPNTPRHEAEIYLDVARALGLDTSDCWANVPVHEADAARVRTLLETRGVQQPFIVVNPAGGRNPGMVMDTKRWPPGYFARLAEGLIAHLTPQPPLHTIERGSVKNPLPDPPPSTGEGVNSHENMRNAVLLGGPGDEAIVKTVQAQMTVPSLALVGELSFGEIAALAAQSRLYVGNDTGMTHLAAAAGAKTVMILGPSDPARYAPFAPNAMALWKPAELLAGGVASGAPQDWDWERDGISVEEAVVKVSQFLGLS
jgi:ADP-heptose:LPS heptosyltransferase